ncbi:MAG: DUF5681 domain-containing protein [Rhodomicrobium sp.]
MTFKPGMSGNPQGKRPGTKNKTTIELRDAAREYSDAALRTLAYIMEHGKSETARISAACEILDRGFGKPAQDLAIDHNIRPMVVGPLEPISEDHDEWAAKARALEARRQAQMRAQNGYLQAKEDRRRELQAQLLALDSDTPDKAPPEPFAAKTQANGHAKPSAKLDYR